jgi:formylglycine-generating enzyme required for sulfatase activity/serine/threonine protein kinase
VAKVVESLRELGLLEAAAMDEMAASLLPRFDTSRELLTELVRRRWLTPFQMERLLRGKPQDLQVGPYLLLAQLGKGGMGNVFKARHQLLNRIVALKVVRKDMDEDATNERRFRREIQATAQLSHPNIVVAHDAGCAEGVHFFAMEYIEGTDLARLVKESGPLPVTRACDFIRHAALGLQHAYEHGLVHRDIKPSNLIVTTEGSRVKIVDMGLVRLGQEPTEAALTESGTVVGTPDYLAPEQATNSKTVDIRADLYSLGCTFYFLLIGRHPFPDGSALEKLLKHLQERATPVRDLRPEIPPAVAAVVEQLMAKNPDDRYQRPIEVAAVLEPFCDAAAEPLTPPTSKQARGSLPTIRVAKSAPASPAPVEIPPLAPLRGEVSREEVSEPGPPEPQPLAPAKPVEERAGPPANQPLAAPVDNAPAAPAATSQPAQPSEPPPRRRLRVVAAIVLVAACAGAALWRPWQADSGPHRNPPVKNAIGLELVRIPAGEFTMGAPLGEMGRRDEEGPPHKVVFSRSFYMAIHETTVGQFRAFTEATRYQTEAENKGAGALRWDAAKQTWQLATECTWRNPGWPVSDDQPVVCVSRKDALAFCYWLSRIESKVYRLPFEAEWEYACRAETTTPYATGQTLSLRDASFGSAGLKTTRVGSFAPNAWGLFDMHGNAWEWCADGYNPTYYQVSPARDPTGPDSGSEGILRGGSWQSDASECRSARRRAAPSDARRNDTGFRVVREAGVR